MTVRRGVSGVANCGERPDRRQPQAESSIDRAGAQAGAYSDIDTRHDAEAELSRQLGNAVLKHLAVACLPASLALPRRPNLDDEDVETLTKRLTPTLGFYVVLNYLVIALFILVTAQRTPAPTE
jgi:hypothetical protein